MSSQLKFDGKHSIMCAGLGKDCSPLCTCRCHDESMKWLFVCVKCGQPLEEWEEEVGECCV